VTTESTSFPKLHFREPLDEKLAWEISSKGWYAGLIVELENGLRFSVFLYDATRLAQDLESEIALGRPFIAEPGMIVISEITEENIRTAIQQLHREGWFDHLLPINQE